MITFDEVLNLNYYKKTSYTGWMNGMRFLIKREVVKEQTTDENGETVETETPQFHAWVWPGPYIFSLTPDDKKLDYTAPFSDEGKQAIVDWINETYTSHEDMWSTEKKTIKVDK